MLYIIGVDEAASSEQDWLLGVLWVLLVLLTPGKRATFLHFHSSVLLSSFTPVESHSLFFHSSFHQSSRRFFRG